MEEKPGRKRESIDEILSDLNGLLNKMPSILDGIKMPELQPAEPPKPASHPESKPEPEASLGESGPASSGGGDKADKTVVLPAFSRLEEGSPAPAEIHTAASVQAPREESFQPPEPAAAGIPVPEPQRPERAEEPFAAAAPGQSQAVTHAPASEQEPEESPVVPETPAPEPGPLETSAPSFAAEQTGLAPQELWVEQTTEAAPEGALPVPETVADQAEKTVSLEAFSGLTEGAPEPLNEEEDGPGTEEGPSALIPGQGAVPEQGGEVFAERPENAAPEAPGAAEAGEPAALPSYENTKDFGVPDIDSLLQLSGGEPERNEEPQASLPEAGVIPESVQAMENNWGISAEGADSAGERPSEEGASMQPRGPEEEKEAQPPAEAAPEESGQPGPEPEAQASPSPFDSFAVDAGEVPGTETEPQGGAGEDQAGGQTPTEKPSPEGEAPASEQPAAPSLEFETPADAISGGGQGQAEIPGAAERNVPGSIELFQAAEPAPSAEAPAQPAAGAPGLELGASPASAEPPSGIPGLELGASPAVPEPAATGAAGIEIGASAASAEQTLPGGTGMELGAGPSASGEETLAVPAPEAPTGEEDKTAIFEASPSVTSRAQAGDLSGLAAKTPPEGIPPERIRSLMLMYSPEDKALCATVLAELDSICLKSVSKPMFIKRVSVREFEPGMSTEFLRQSVADSGAKGLVCLGSIPQDKIYELENVFSSSGGFFRYYDSSMFSHSSALDLVTDLILR